MKLQIEEETTYNPEVMGSRRTFWRWNCCCGTKGHWQDLSTTNSINGGMHHLKEVHGHAGLRVAG